MGITESDVTAILEQINLLALLENDYGVTFTESGVNRWKACCPFPGHNDKTPSFYVFADENRYKCFGCGAGGTAVGAIMRLDRISYNEAVCKLAEMVGYEAFLTPDGAIDRTLRDIKNLIADTLSNRESGLPLGLSEIGFMNLVRNRLQTYCEIAEVDITDPFVDARFMALDDLLEVGDYSGCKRFWHALDGEVREKVISYKRLQHEQSTV